MRVLYVQYTNPGAYPPIVRGAHILADAGAHVLLLGIQVPELEALGMADGPGISARLLPATSAAWRLKSHYARYAAWVTHIGVSWKPEWIYASDMFAAPIALALSALTRARVVYHEHDAPSTEHSSWAVRQCLAARRRLLQRADVVVAPNVDRAERLSELAGGRQVVTAWNCPRRPNVRPSRSRQDSRLRVIYGGSINAERVPFAVIDAVARVPDVELDLVGYETIGSRGYVQRLASLAVERAVGDRLRVRSAMHPSELEAAFAKCDLGLALMPVESRDENMQHMTGASNKVFEYLVSGVVPLVSDTPDWRTTFVDPGYALACDPRHPESIAFTLAWAQRNRESVHDIAGRGWQRLQEDWNYETQFAPVLRALLGARVSTSTAVASEPTRGVHCAS